MALHAARGQAAAAVVDKQRLIVANRAADREVVLQSRERFAPDRHDAFLAPFAEDSHQLLLQVEATDIQAGEFADAQATGVEQLEDCPIAQRQVTGAVAALHQGAGFVDRQGLGEVAVALRGGQPRGGVGGEDSLAHQVAEEGPQGRELAGDRGALVVTVEFGQVAAQQQVVDALQSGCIGSAGAGEKSLECGEVTPVRSTGVRREVALDGEVLLEPLDPTLHGGSLTHPAGSPEDGQRLTGRSACANVAA
jgi:hypothetical protein